MNIRLRQLKKVMTDEDFYYYEQENRLSPECLCCRGEIRKRSWDEDGPGGYGCVETDERCRSCSYSRNWSYGYTSLIVGEWYAEYRYNTPQDEAKRIEREFELQIKLERNRRKLLKQKIYRKRRCA